jgi:tetratricopeptide (TPR) repeat protein
MHVDGAKLGEIRARYEQGLCLQAYEIAREHGRFQEWRGTEALLLAGRLAMNLGASRLGEWLHLRAYREAPDDPEARYYYARTVLGRRGPLAAWKLLRRFGEFPDAPSDLRSDWLAFHGDVAGLLRDFDTAEHWLARALEAAPDNPWIYIERSSLLQYEDRYEEALDAARHALELRPWYRPGVQAAAHALQLVDRQNEALALLQEACGRIENAPVVAQLALLQMQREDWKACRESLDRYARLSPLLEKEGAQWLAAVGSDVAYHLGDFPRAVQLARETESPFFEKIADRLEAATEDDRRVLLPVGWVRQHYMTCAPATLSAVSRYWQMPAEHLGVAEAICYDGTPDHSERTWAEENGWLAREFRITWESAVALLDRGVAFTLTTVGPATAHLQAVIGYDSRRGTFLIRDPYHSTLAESLAVELLEHYRSVGPRGMAMVPRHQAGLLEGVELPEAPLYDHLHRVQRALLQHDREAAQASYEALSDAAPEHRLALQARRSLAAYDADTTEMLACIERLQAQFPEDANLQLCRLSCLRELARRDERLALLKETCDRKDADPIFWQQYAQELSADAREHERAVVLLRRSMRARPGDAGCYFILANTLWDQRRFEEGLDLYRFAACLDDKDEQLSRSYFLAARYFKQTETALRFLRNRFKRFGARSSQPARTLFAALNEVDRAGEGFEVLEEALRLRPEDGDLLLYAADARGRHGEFERAAELLEAARGKTGRTAWLRTAALLASYRGELKTALARWRQVAEAEPLAIDAHRSVARLLAQTDSPEAAARHFEEAAARFPHHYALHRLWTEWLRDEDPERAEEVLRRLVEIHPADAWARRELALMLARQGRLDEAWEEAETGRRLDPSDPAAYSIRGEVLSRRGEWEEAKEAYREAIRLSVDNGYAIARLVSACDSVAERREALRFIEGELERQTVYGDALLAFRDYARHTLDPEELLASLRAALEARPDLWHAWAAVVRQLIDLDRADEALALARGATARFPLLPALWLDLAAAHAARLDREGERAALRQALQINPGWSPAIRELCASYTREDRYTEARELVEAAVSRDPLDSENHGWLAHVLWETGEKEAAVERVKRALRLEPGYSWAWASLREWCQELERPGEAAALVRELAARRPGEARSWLLLARTLAAPEDLPERLQALEKAVSLNPRCFEACDLRAELLAREGRYEEALEACRPPITEQPPTELKGRAAWIEAERGNMEEAVRRMRAAVDEDPFYYWGWSQLARWHDTGGPDDAYLEAAQMLVRLAPHEPTPHGILGDARLRTGDRPGARDAFKRAMDLAPDYAFAGMSLLDLQLEDGDLGGAAATLALLREHVGGEWVLARAVRLAVRQGDPAAARERLRELCLFPSESGRALAAAAGEMDEKGWTREAEAVYEEVLEHPEAQPLVGELWVRARVKRADWSFADRLRTLRVQGKIGYAATAAYLEALGTAKRKGPLRSFLREYRDALRVDTGTWASAGFALLSIDDNREAVAWLADWEDRPDVQPWMLLHYALGLRCLGRGAEASAVGRTALSLPDEDGSVVPHALWLALDEALARDTAAAAGRLAGTDAAALDPYCRFLYSLVQAMLGVQGTETRLRASAFPAARKRMAEARTAKPDYWKDSLLRRTYTLSAWRVANDVGGLWAAVWALLQFIPWF